MKRVLIAFCVGLALAACATPPLERAPVPQDCPPEVGPGDDDVDGGLGGTGAAPPDIAEVCGAAKSG